MIRQHWSEIALWIGHTHKSHIAHAALTFTDTNQTNTSPKEGHQLRQLPRSSQNLHAEPSHLRAKSPPKFFLFLLPFLGVFTQHIRTLAISWPSHFSLAKTHDPNRAPGYCSGIPAEGHMFYRSRVRSHAAQCRPWKAEPVTTSALPGTTLGSLTKRPFTWSLPALHRTARLWRGSGLCIRLSASGGPNCL